MEIPVALEAFIASKEVLVRRPAPPGIRPFLEINGQYRFFFFTQQSQRHINNAFELQMR